MSDIAKIGLTDLRSRVTIIPQDPTILSGTLRSTLDIFDEYDDADTFAALRRVHLLKDEEAAAEEDELSRNKNVFRDLGSQVSEGGENMSSGEKQLVWCATSFQLDPCDSFCMAWRERFCGEIEFCLWTKRQRRLIVRLKDPCMSCH